MEFQFTYSFQPKCGPGRESTSKKMNTRILPVRKGLPARKVNSLATACEPIF
jgi:hypothetical protein